MRLCPAMTLKPPQDFHADSNFTLTGGLKTQMGPAHERLPAEDFPIGLKPLAEGEALGERLRVRCTVRLLSPPEHQVVFYRTDTGHPRIRTYRKLLFLNGFLIPVNSLNLTPGRKTGDTGTSVKPLLFCALAIILLHPFQSQLFSSNQN